MFFPNTRSIDGRAVQLVRQFCSARESSPLRVKLLRSPETLSLIEATSNDGCAIAVAAKSKPATEVFMAGNVTIGVSRHFDAVWAYLVEAES